MPSEKDGVMIILSSPSGAGKTTLVKKLSQKDNFEVSISHTTRKPRQKENQNEIINIKPDVTAINALSRIPSIDSVNSQRRLIQLKKNNPPEIPEIFLNLSAFFSCLVCSLDIIFVSTLFFGGSCRFQGKRITLPSAIQLANMYRRGNGQARKAKIKASCLGFKMRNRTAFTDKWVRPVITS